MPESYQQVRERKHDAAESGEKDGISGNRKLYFTSLLCI